MTETSWDYVVKIGRAFTDDDLLFETRKDLALAAFRKVRAELPVEDGFDIDDPDEELNWILDDLESSPDIKAFDEEWLGRLYPWADRHRVWIDVFAD
jgi:hypothetical protein